MRANLQKLVAQDISWRKNLETSSLQINSIVNDDFQFHLKPITTQLLAKKIEQLN